LVARRSHNPKVVRSILTGRICRQITSYSFRSVSRQFRSPVCFASLGTQCLAHNKVANYSGEGGKLTQVTQTLPIVNGVLNPGPSDYKSDALPLSYEGTYSLILQFFHKPVFMRGQRIFQKTPSRWVICRSLRTSAIVISRKRTYQGLLESFKNYLIRCGIIWAGMGRCSWVQSPAHAFCLATTRPKLELVLIWSRET
jgi:hypothetical protein